MSKTLRCRVSAHISDVHFGAFDSDELLKELRYQFLNKLKHLPQLDVIYIQGDLYHYELSLNSKHARNSFTFIDLLLQLAYEKNAKVRIIVGTRSHDFNQLNNIMSMRKDVDIRVINRVQEEELFTDYKVLYLPEEYIKDPQEYYYDYFNVDDGYYNAIVGHGFFEENCFSNHNSETVMKAAPIFNSKELIRICSGPITFGHDHSATHIKKKIFYTGSFSRWCQGEEEPKGFFISINNVYNENFKIIPVQNIMARKFVSRTITKLLKKYEVETIINIINEYMEIHNIFNFRLIAFEVNDSVIMTKLSILQSHLRNNKNINLVIKKNSITIDEDDLNDQILEKYDYLFDDGIELEEKVSTYINTEFDYNISDERVDEILNGNIIKLINDRM